MRTRLVAVVAAAVAVTTLTACGSVQDVADTAGAVANTASTVQVCADALSQAAVILDPGSPEQALDKAHDAAASLDALAANAVDTTVNEAITAVATTLRDVTLEDLVVTPAVWLETKATQVANLANACS
ncbi:bacteriophage spanin2 family protein [Saccharothrix deserti]|uniref:bacteriophage spanin2 family protein n=1 Tax=Saccharothrix deserti TaxID=2593674 RepID=UPI00131CD32B|nr:bacteriophage spanin2 family protein [Saccharothrix deserti]